MWLFHEVTLGENTCPAGLRFVANLVELKEGHQYHIQTWFGVISGYLFTLCRVTLETGIVPKQRAV